MKRAMVALILGMMAGCSGGESDGSGAGERAGTGNAGPMDGGALVVTLGSGLTVHQPLTEGQAVELVMGPQGGWHLDLTVRGCGQAPAGLTLNYRVQRPDGSVVYARSQADLTARNVVMEADGCFVRVGDRAVMSIVSPQEVVDREVRVDVEAWRGTERLDARAVGVVVVDREP